MEPNPNNKNLIPMSIIVAGAMIAGAIYFGSGKPATIAKNDNAVDTSKIEIAEITSEDHILGDKNAPIVVVEYSDLECPFCKVFHGTMKEVVRAYEGKVAWVYRQYPIAQLHSRAPKESEASECAAELGGNTAFWKFVDTVLERTQSNNSLDPALLPVIAGDIGLDVNAFNSCLSSGKYTNFINESVKKAMEAGAQGTPYSVIVTKDGTKAVINGAESLATVKRKIDALLK